MNFEVLTEGESDVPVVREVLSRRFGLQEGGDFRIHPHRGKGRLPDNVMARPDPKNRTLLHQLPAKLRGYAHLGSAYCVLVLVDAVKAAYPRADRRKLGRVTPDAVVGAWEKLADALALGSRRAQHSGADKTEWARNIAPHLNLNQPRSPSLAALVSGVSKVIS